MGKRGWIIVSVALFIACCVLGGFLYSRTELCNSLLADKADLQQENLALQAELDTANDKNVSLQSELDTLQEDYDRVNSEYISLSNEYSRVSAELVDANGLIAAFQSVCPPRHFTSRAELQNWRNEAGIIPYNSNIYSWCEQLQEKALEDGFIVSVSSYYDYDDFAWYTCCLATAGDSVYSFYPDEFTLYYEREVILWY